MNEKDLEKFFKFTDKKKNTNFLKLLRHKIEIAKTIKSTIIIGKLRKEVLIRKFTYAKV